MSAIITIENLTKRFGDIVAVSGLSLHVEAGEMFGLVGPDGAGKTTTIRMLCGILAPTGAKRTVLGYDIVKEPDRVKREIGYLSQRFSLYGDLTSTRTSSSSRRSTGSTTTSSAVKSCSSSRD